MKLKETHKVLIIIALILAGALWQIVTFFLEHRTITNYPPKGTHIIALGDSLTFGIGASSPENGYVPILAKRLNVQIENAGVSGDTSLDALQRLEKDVLSKNPNIVIVLLGGNDYLRHIPEQDTFTNLRTIITTLHSKGIVVILLGVRGGLLTDHFDKNFKSLAKETGALFVPNVLKDIIGNNSLMYDQVHPNDAGYLKIVDRVAPSLEGLLLGVATTTPS